MFLDALQILHLPKCAIDWMGDSVKTVLPNAFRMETCQRTIWVFPTFVGSASRAFSEIPGAQVFSGSEAFQFLLKVATGLQSQVQGETDVFGQLKESWAKYEASEGSFFSALNPWMQKIFEDTKEIRAIYLQNLGGASYGSLVRRTLRSYTESSQEPVLLLGAGQIATSVAPWLAERELWVWNRTPAALTGLLADVKAKVHHAKVRVLSTPTEEEEGFARAAQLVVCIPTHAQDDLRRVKAWADGNARLGLHRPVVHLGGVRTECKGWEILPEFNGLDSLFALQKVQDGARSKQITRAFRACERKARLRGLSGSATGSSTLPHGWEDLAVFA